MITFRKFVCMCAYVFVHECTCLCMHAFVCMCGAGEQIQDLMHTKHALYPSPDMCQRQVKESLL